MIDNLPAQQYSSCRRKRTFKIPIPIIAKELSNMSSPGFTAEASLYKTAQQYCTTGMMFGESNTLHPATLGSFVLPAACPAACRDFCLRCKRGCLDLIGPGRGQCLRDCEICD
jgi:hypothetical protein